jgi:hypothetical protein
MGEDAPTGIVASSPIFVTQTGCVPKSLPFAVRGLNAKRAGSPSVFLLVEKFFLALQVIPIPIDV